MDGIEDSEDTLLTLTADIVAAHVSNNSVAVNDLPNLIQNVHSALSGISTNRSAPEAKPEPKVSVRASVKPDYIVCLEDGKKQKMLKRHLMTNHGLTPDEYRRATEVTYLGPIQLDHRIALLHLGAGLHPHVDHGRLIDAFSQVGKSEFHCVSPK